MHTAAARATGRYGIHISAAWERAALLLRCAVATDEARDAEEEQSRDLPHIDEAALGVRILRVQIDPARCPKRVQHVAYGQQAQRHPLPRRARPHQQCHRDDDDVARRDRPTTALFRTFLAAGLEDVPHPGHPRHFEQRAGHDEAVQQEAVRAWPGLPAGHSNSAAQAPTGYSR